MTKRILQILISFAFIFIFFSAAEGQSGNSPGKPDFSGTWLLDTKKSNSAGLSTRPDLPITVSHHDPEFRVTLQSESNSQIVKKEFVYFTDGRGETNEATSMLSTSTSTPKPEVLKNQVTKSKTKWSGDKVVTRARLRLNVAGLFVEFEQVDE